MDWADISTIVGSLGFPIFCCVMLFKQNNELRESIDGLKDVMNKVLNRLEKD